MCELCGEFAERVHGIRLRSFVRIMQSQGWRPTWDGQGRVTELRHDCGVRIDGPLQVEAHHRVWLEERRLPRV